MNSKPGYIYILSNKSGSTLYTGVTSDIVKRLEQNRLAAVDSFTRRYHVHKLVYFMRFDSIREAIEMEKKIKGGSRQKKLDLIESINSKYEDLSGSLVDCFGASRLAMTT